MNRWILNVSLFIAALVAAGLGLYLGSGMREKLQPVEFRYEESTPNSLLGVGEEFPDITLMQPDSSMASTSSILASGGVVIFMELGCPPCSVMSVNWTTVLDTWANRPPVIGIASAPLDQIARYREHLDVGFPVLSDTGMVFETAYQVIDFPLRLIIDHAGIIRSVNYDSHEIIDTAMITSLIRSDSSTSLTSR